MWQIVDLLNHRVWNVKHKNIVSLRGPWKGEKQEVRAKQKSSLPNVSNVRVCSGESGEADPVRPVPVGEAVARREAAGGAGDRPGHQGQEAVWAERHHPPAGDRGTAVTAARLHN